MFLLSPSLDSVRIPRDVRFQAVSSQGKWAPGPARIDRVRPGRICGFGSIALFEYVLFNIIYIIRNMIKINDQRGMVPSSYKKQKIAGSVH